jgi:hypothetical protein
MFKNWRPYERILDGKARPAVDVLKDLIARELLDALDQFPPPESDLEWEDAALEQRLRGRLHELPRVDDALADLVLELVALDVGHQLEQIDHMLRNQHHRERAPTQLHVDAMHLLWRGLVEHLYARKEDAGAILKGRDLVDIAETARRARSVREG